VRILSRYFVWRFLKYFTAILIASTIGISTVEMLLNFDDVLRVGQDSANIAEYLLLRIPSYYLRDLVPVSAFAAAFMSVGMAARWLETTASKAGGISPGRIVTPLLVTSAVLSLGTFGVNETLVVQATQRWAQLERGDTRLAAFRQGSFWYHSGRTIYNIKEADREARTFEQVRIYYRNSRGRLTSSLYADHVQIEDSHHWLFEKGSKVDWSSGRARCKFV
jgi:lipopolysaccharide export LptBFGC system permease protein LptF